ncbi:MAG: cupin domain-containing protein [Acidobacteriota bacterium]|nr:cupin domain-containing protein [Acidobacteriota bacterium]
MKKYQLCLVILALLGVVSLGLAQTAKKAKRHAGSGHAPAAHVLVTPDQVKWGPGPPSLAPGAQLAVLEGDPSKPGVPFAVRAKFPDGYRVPPHWHPTDERVVVLEGSLGVGVGNKFDESAGHKLPVGSYASMPKGLRHYAWAIGETVVQISGVGPFEVNYVNAADDPRKAPKQ